MSPRESFGVAIRIIGLIISIIALLYFLSAVLIILVPNYKPHTSPAWHYLLSGGVGLALGLYLLRGASHVMRFAYPQEKE